MDSIALRLRLFLIVLSVVLIVGTVGFAAFEGLSLVDSLYFSVVTVATVGYGDIHPVTSGGKLLAVVLILTGVGTFLGVVANATELLLVKRQEALRKERLNMVIGLFLSEIGAELLRQLAVADPDLDPIRKEVLVAQDWSDKDFARASERLRKRQFGLDVARLQLKPLRDFMAQKSALMLRLLENPNLQAHESFTELLRAVFHVREELLSRPDLDDLPDTDREHLVNDAKRAYILLMSQWMGHVQYLKANYPYLFSLAVRLNPFREAPAPIVR
jgi:hypothetical protein